MPPKKKGRAPAHQNKVAFREFKHQVEIWSAIKNSPSPHLCVKCSDIIKWRKQYHKYKPLKQSTTCEICTGKEVKHAYHVICQGCARKAGVCAKCREPGAIAQDDAAETETKVQQEDLQFMKLRQRRSLLRKMQQGTKPSENAGDASVPASNQAPAGDDSDSGSKESFSDVDDDDIEIAVQASKQGGNPNQNSSTNTEKMSTADDVLIKAMADAAAKLKLVDAPKQ
eukprot:c24841_g1_i1.p1 GENE.c24841_g1_i1~~c24841_g1_i1.p1  ORF type:complete len:226 (-),score=37.11 c24841_g1_i1:129-806(-)